jgi:PAS domain S-box-containing protein
MDVGYEPKGSSALDAMPLGTHSCHFYETEEDHVASVIPYLRAGLDRREFCMWMIGDPMTEALAWDALGRVVPDLGTYRDAQAIEILPSREWYFSGGALDLQRATQGWSDKLADALGRGHPGMRVTGGTLWLPRADWDDFCAYEQELNAAIENQPLSVLCMYPLQTSGAAEVLDAARTHRFTSATRRGQLETLETSELKLAKAGIERLNVTLERRVVERTHQLELANRDLMREVASRQRAEGAVRSSDRQFHALFDESTVGIGLFDATGRFTNINRSCERLLGYSLSELRGMTSDEVIGRLMHPEDAPTVRRLFSELLDGHRDQYSLTERYYRKDGAMAWGNFAVSLVRDEARRPVFGILMAEDITERRSTEEALRKTQSELTKVARVMTLGEMTASIAHEVNQPLAAVTTNADACLRWLARDRPNLDEARAAVQRIVDDSSRATAVVQRIRKLVQKAEPQMILLDVNDVISEVLNLVRQELRRQAVALHTELAEHLPAVSGDRIQLQQVILNLVMNGVEAMGASPPSSPVARELTILSELRDGRSVYVAVRDTGRGLDEATLPHLFDAFFTNKPGGMGLGLSISRSIVDAHGGRIWATSRPEGAALELTLPIAERA